MSSGTAGAGPGAIVPARLGFFAIFNSHLAASKNHPDDQIVYFASDPTQDAGGSKTGRPGRPRGRPAEALTQEERDERLRQIGLAQAMIDFGRGFADNATLKTVDTEQTRVVTQQVEPGWWILAVSRWHQDSSMRPV